MKISVLAIAGEVAIDARFGQEVFRQTSIELSHGNQVELDFSGVKIFTIEFLKYSVGQLLREYSPETLRKQVTLSGVPSYVESTLHEVIESARKFYGYS